MTTERDPRTRILLSWLREDAHENAEPMLLRALDEVDATPQRRSWWPAWRSDSMSTYAKWIAAAAAVLLVAVVGYQFLPGSGRVGGEPSIAPSPSPSLLARGEFRAQGAAVELDAIGRGSGATGRMTVSDTPDASGDFTIDLECTRTTADGMIMIGGDARDSTSTWAPNGTRAAIVLQPGSPVGALFWFESPDPPRASCLAFLEWADAHTDSAPLDPIQGTVQLGQ